MQRILQTLKDRLARSGTGVSNVAGNADNSNQISSMQQTRSVAPSQQIPTTQSQSAENTATGSGVAQVETQVANDQSQLQSEKESQQQPDENVEPEQPNESEKESQPPTRGPKKGSKRSTVKEGENEEKRPKERGRRGPGKRKKNQDQDELKFDENELYLVNIEAGDLDFEEETNTAMEAVLKRRKDTALTTASSELQPLSDWRIAHEVIRHRVQRAHGSSVASGSAFVDGDPGFGADFLQALQLGFAAFSRNVMQRATQNARHRIASAHRPTNFLLTSDPRRGVGAIRRREEAEAEAKARAEREALLKAAGSKRADEETRAMAQKARAELIGQEAAAAANRALAATFGGKHAKWASVASASKSGAKRAKILKDTNKSKDSKGANANVADTEAARTSITEEITINMEDLVFALENDPIFCRSPLLYKLINGLNT